MLSDVEKCSMVRAKYHLINRLKKILIKYTILSFMYWTDIHQVYISTIFVKSVTDFVVRLINLSYYKSYYKC